MAAMSDYFENHLLDWLFRGQALGINGATAEAGSGPTNLYLALFTSGPTDASGGTEVSTAGTGYGRVAVASTLANWAATQAIGTIDVSTGSSGTTSNNIAITFGAPVLAWGTVSHFGIMDASAAGNVIFWGALTVAKTVNQGDAAPSFAAGSLTLQIDN